MRGLIDDSFTADANDAHMEAKLKYAEERAAANAAIVEVIEAQLAEFRGKGPIAADEVRAGWEGTTDVQNTGVAPGRFGAAALEGLGKSAEIKVDQEALFVESLPAEGKDRLYIASAGKWRQGPFKRMGGQHSDPSSARRSSSPGSSASSFSRARPCASTCTLCSVAWSGRSKS